MHSIRSKVNFAWPSDCTILKINLIKQFCVLQFCKDACFITHNPMKHFNSSTCSINKLDLKPIIG